jgi:hypothetical protein
MLITGMTHPWVFQTEVSGLETLRTPAKMRQEFLKRGKSVDISYFGNDGS